MRTRNQGYTPLAREPLASGHSRASGLFFPLIVRSLASERPAPTGERAGLAIGARSRATARERSLASNGASRQNDRRAGEQAAAAGERAGGANPSRGKERTG